MQSNKDIEIDEEGHKNLVRMFDVLLKVDKRNNPELYGKPPKETKEE